MEVLVYKANQKSYQKRIKKSQINIKKMLLIHQKVFTAFEPIMINIDMNYTKRIRKRKISIFHV